MTRETKALLFAMLAVLLWSTVATAFKLALERFSPIQVLFVATLTSFLSILIIILTQNKLQLLALTIKQKSLKFICLSLLNPCAYYLTLFSAYDLLPASEAQPLNYTWAIALTLFGAIFLKQKIRKRDWLACCMGYCGVLIIATRGDVVGMSFTNTTGVLLALSSTLLWAAYWILNTKDKSDAVVSMCLCFLFGSLWLIPALIYMEGFSFGFLFSSNTSLLAAIYVGMFEMGFTFVFWLMAMRFSSNTALVSNLIFISPFISLYLLSVFIGETIYPSTIIGLVFIVIGLLFQQISLPSLSKLKRKAM